MNPNNNQILENTNNIVKNKKSCKWDILCILISVLAILYSIYVVSPLMVKAYPHGEGGSADYNMKNLYDFINLIGITVYITLIAINIQKINYVRCLNYPLISITISIQILLFFGPLGGFIGILILPLALIISIILFIIGIIKDCKK